MAHYELNITLQKGKNIKSLNGVLEAAKRLAPAGSSVILRKCEVASSRQARLDEAVGNLEEAVSTIEELQGEMQDWYDNLPEGLQSSDKGDQVQQAADDLQTTLDSAQEALNNAEDVKLEPEDMLERLMAAVKPLMEPGVQDTATWQALVGEGAWQTLVDTYASIKDKYSEGADTLKEAGDQAQEAVDNASSVEFPGAYN